MLRVLHSSDLRLEREKKCVGFLLIQEIDFESPWSVNPQVRILDSFQKALEALDWKLHTKNNCLKKSKAIHSDLIEIFDKKIGETLWNTFKFDKFYFFLRVWCRSGLESLT